MSAEHDSSLGLPGQREIDDKVPFKRNLEALLNRVFHPDGTINGDDPHLREVMELADTKDLDVILTPHSSGTRLFFGKWLADHKGLVEIGAITTLGITAVAGSIGAGIVLRRHQRKNLERK